MRHSIMRCAVAAALPVTVFLVAALPTGSEAAKVSGKFTVKYSQQHQLPVTDAAGPVLLANEARGTNTNTGGTDYMNGATVTSIEIADLTRGNGIQQGYITFSKNGESSVSRWNGKVHTTLSADKQPVTTFDGTWTKISGSGRYEEVSGSGRYQGKMVSPTEYVVEWEGELGMKPTS
jgi:hypothetical protein